MPFFPSNLQQSWVILSHPCTELGGLQGLDLQSVELDAATI